MEKTTKSKKRRPRTICYRCIQVRPPRYDVRVVGNARGNDTRFCCADGYRDHVFGAKKIDTQPE